MLALLKNANLGLALLLEIGVLAALCYFGFVVEASWPGKIGLGLGLPVVAIVIWAIFGAPTSRRRLKGFPFLLLQIIWFGSAAVALYLASQSMLALIFALLFVLNTVLAYTWDQKKAFPPANAKLKRYPHEVDHCTPGAVAGEK
ncbi:YrdB family protein [Ktedonobacteria bacterium brp13]|nr:YrdB family protein [Ktedonobacteria bacterium brp13]